MKTNFLICYLIVMLLGTFQVKAQITFTNFKVDNNSSVDVYIGSQVPTQTHQFSVTGRRLTGSNLYASVFIYLVDRYTGDAAATSIAGPTTTSWTSNPDGYDYCTINGSISLDDGVIQYGNFNKLRAIGQDQSNVTTLYPSNDVTINRTTPPPPAISSLSPATGPTTTPFTIAGTIVGTISQVSFGGINLGTSLSTSVPTGVSPGSYPVTVTTNTGTSNTLNFTVTPSATTGPSVSISPTSGLVGSTITISATQSWYAYSNITVMFNGAPISYTRGTNANQIQVTVPATATVGTGTIVVTTASGNATASFSVVAPPAPVITRIFPNASEGERVKINGTNLLNVTSISFNGTPCTFLSDGAGAAWAKVPNGSYIGNTIGAVALTTSQGTATFPFTVLPQNRPANVLTSSQYLRTGDLMGLETDVDWANYLARGYPLPTVIFNGISCTAVSYATSSSALDINSLFQKNTLLVRVPQGITSGLVKISNQFGIGSGVTYNVADEQPYIPCGINTVICSDQRVAYGSVPNIINGRVLADDNSTGFRIYAATIIGSPFAAGSEREWVQWQYSYSNNWNDWHDINGNATSSSFQPWACYATTYYRRVSSHIRYRFPTNYREEWYISDAVKIIPYTPINPGVYKIRNRYTGQLLEIGGGGGVTINQGAFANQWPDVGTANQQWQIIPTADGMYKIINRNSRQALEIGGGNAQPPGSPANQLTYGGGLNQQWLFIPNGSYFTITSASSGQELEIPNGSTQQGARAGQWTPNGGSAWAQWELIPVNVTSSTKFPGVCTIRNVQSNKVLEIGGVSTSAGATANQYDYLNLASQEWTIVEEPTTTYGGIYKIINRNSGLALDMPNSSLNNGSVPIQYPYGGGLNQRWEIDEMDPGEYVLISYNTMYSFASKVLEVSMSNIFDNGASVQQQDYTGNKNQSWIITSVSQNRTAGGVTKDLSPLALYPNPASDKVTIVTDGQEGKAVFYDAMGVARKTTKLQAGASESEVSLQGLPAGVYHVKIVIPGQAPLTKQLIVKP